MGETSTDATTGPFTVARDAVLAAVSRPEFELHRIEAPAGVAPDAIALAGDVRPTSHGVDSVLGTGRFILLHDPDEPEAWGGAFRIVAFAQAPLEVEIGIDPFVAGVAWSWLLDSLDSGDAEYHSASGTATKILSTGFGELAGADSAQLELRASWTPAGDDLTATMTAHAEAWVELVCLLAGLPPRGETVGLLPHLRAARD